MNAPLKSLLQVAGTLVVLTGAGVGSYLVYQPKAGVSLGQLVDAGLRADCNKRKLRCWGVNGDGSYASKELVVGVCPDDNATSVVIAQSAPAGWDVVGCRDLGSTTDAEGITSIGHECACRPRAGGVCNGSTGQPLPLGMPAGPSLKAPYDSFSGAGCVPTPCRQFAGRPSLPAACQ